MLTLGANPEGLRNSIDNGTNGRKRSFSKLENKILDSAIDM